MLGIGLKSFMLVCFCDHVGTQTLWLTQRVRHGFHGARIDRLKLIDETHNTRQLADDVVKFVCADFESGEIAEFFDGFGLE